MWCQNATVCNNWKWNLQWEVYKTCFYSFNYYI